MTTNLKRKPCNTLITYIMLTFLYLSPQYMYKETKPRTFSAQGLLLNLKPLSVRSLDHITQNSLKKDLFTRKPNSKFIVFKQYQVLLKKFMQLPTKIVSSKK